MLQEVTRVTASVAQGICAEYPNVGNLVEGFRKDGPTALEDIKVRDILVGVICSWKHTDVEAIQKAANKNGAVSDRRIGPAVSKTLYRVFMNEDPWIDV